jgi:hypothetical protein
MRLTYLTARRGVASRRTTPMDLRLHERRSRRHAAACPGQPRHNLQPEERLHDQIRESLRKLWRKARPCQPPPSRPALLPQNLQGEFPCENGEGPCVDETVVWLRTSQGFAGDGRTGISGRGHPSLALLIRVAWSRPAGSLAPERCGGLVFTFQSSQPHPRDTQRTNIRNPVSSPTTVICPLQGEVSSSRNTLPGRSRLVSPSVVVMEKMPCRTMPN